MPKFKNLLILFAFSVGIKLVYLCFSIAVLGDKSEGNIFDTYIQTTKKYDAFWYEKIATSGYPKLTDKREIGYSNGKIFKQSEWAFFPLYPSLIKGFNYFFGLDYNTSAFFLSLLFSFLSLIAMFWLGLLFFENEKKSYFATFLLFLFPFSFYFSMLYTEALFFTFLIFSFISIYYKNYFLLSILLIPLILLRPNGIILLIPLYLYHLEQNNLLTKWHFLWRNYLTKKQLLQTCAFLTGPIAFGLYCLFQYQITGFPFAFSIAQAGWYREFMFPILAFFRKGDLATQFNSIYTILFIVYAFLIRKKLPLSFNTLIWISIILPLCSGSVTSMTRFISILFPLFFVLSAQIAALKSKTIILFCLFLLHLLSFSTWLFNLVISN